jgi:hypothetical protein
MKNYHFSYLFWYYSMVKSVELVATEALAAFRASFFWQRIGHT